MGEDIGLKIDLVDKNANQDISRREFLKGAAVLVGAAVTLAACGRNNDINASKSEEQNFEDNIKDLNSQYTLREQQLGPFSYDKYINEYPKFEGYIQHIDKTAQSAERERGVKADVFKTLISSIIATHIDNIEQIDTSRSLE